jgi:GT2 family glycosyltransferase
MWRQAIPVIERPSVAVIVVNYNGGEYLIRCLTALTEQTCNPDLVIVVDNNSQDGSLDEASARFSHYQYIRNSSNRGFAEGNNQALVLCKEQQMEYVALLNPDAFPEKNWLEELLDLAMRHPGLGSVASRMMEEGCHDRVDGAGDFYHMFGAARRRGHGQRLRPEWLVEEEVFGACAGAALYRTEALLEVGFFDVDFFCYMEDVDLAYRLQLAGYVCWYNPAAVVQHIGSASTGYHSDFSVYYGQRNMIWTFFKNTPGPLLVLLLPGHIIINIVALGLGLTRGQFRVMLRAKIDGLKGLKNIWRKRASVQKKKSLALADNWRVLSKSMTSRI